MTMPAPLRAATTAPDAQLAAKMRADAATLADLFFDAFCADTPVGPAWCLAAAVLLSQFAQPGAPPSDATSGTNRPTED